MSSILRSFIYDLNMIFILYDIYIYINMINMS